MAKVLVSAFVDFIAQTEVPVASVVEQVPGVLPVPEALNWGITPATATPASFFKTIVTVEVATPSASTGPVPLIVEFAADTVVAIPVTDGCSFLVPHPRTKTDKMKSPKSFFTFITYRNF